MQRTEEGRTEETVIKRKQAALYSKLENLSTEGTEKVKTSQFKNNEASNLREPWEL